MEAPGATVLPDAGCALTVTFGGDDEDVDELLGVLDGELWAFDDALGVREDA